jgi:hypothetical protein
MKRPAHSSDPMARWKLALLVLFSLFFLGLVLSRKPGFGLLLLVLGWAVLGLSAFRWGYDSRDGRDWEDRPERRDRLRSPDVRLPRSAEDKLSRDEEPGGA